MSLLEARAVSRRFDARWVLQDVDLTVAEGERVALLGPSGCGKTTLLNLLGGLDRPDRGEVRFRGELLAAAGPRRLAQLRREALGTVSQLFHLVPALTARENVELPLQLLRWPRPRLDARVDELLAAVGLEHRADAWPRELSGGEMRSGWRGPGPGRRPRPAAGRQAHRQPGQRRRLERCWPSWPN